MQKYGDFYSPCMTLRVQNNMADCGKPNDLRNIPKFFNDAQKDAQMVTLLL